MDGGGRRGWEDLADAKWKTGRRRRRRKGDGRGRLGILAALCVVSCRCASCVRVLNGGWMGLG